MYLFFKTINKVQPLKIEDKNNLKNKHIRMN